MVQKQNLPYKPSLGKLFSLKRSRSINVSPIPANASKIHYLDNKDGDMVVLVIKETTKRVEILIDNVRYDMSKYFLQAPVEDTEGKITDIKASLQELVNEYFKLVSNNMDLPAGFAEFGQKLKKLQESCNEDE